MNINKLNYEKYILDYLEGTLSSSERESFNSFLASHPAVQKEIELYLAAPVMPLEEGPSFPDKSILIPKRKNYLIYLIPLLFFVSVVVIYFSIPDSNHKSEILPMTTIESNGTKNKESSIEEKENKSTINVNTMTHEDINQKKSSILKDFQIQTESRIDDNEKNVEPIRFAQNAETNAANNIGEEEDVFMRSIDIDEDLYITDLAVAAVINDNGHSTRELISISVLESNWIDGKVLTSNSAEFSQDKLIHTFNEIKLNTEINRLQEDDKNWYASFIPKSYRNVELEESPNINTGAIRSAENRKNTRSKLIPKTFTK